LKSQRVKLALKEKKELARRNREGLLLVDHNYTVVGPQIRQQTDPWSDERGMDVRRQGQARKGTWKSYRIASTPTAHHWMADLQTVNHHGQVVVVSSRGDLADIVTGV
jgi:hypothetical protein